MLCFANMLFVPEYMDYLRVVESAGYGDMRVFSDAFVKRNKDLYDQYSLWWVKDPLRAWSRGWEYGFVFQAVESVAQEAAGPIKILDAGCGFTFFPFYMADKIGGAEVACCDLDSRLEGLFLSVDCGNARRPAFWLEDVAAMSFADNSFDCVVCVSVLEHLQHRIAAFREMLRIVRPGGRIVVTMDYSRDDRSDVVEAELREFLGAIFPADDAGVKSQLDDFIQVMCSDTALLATHHFLGSRDQLPWKYPVLSSVLSSIRKRKVPRLGVKDIGVLGLVCIKAG